MDNIILYSIFEIKPAMKKIVFCITLTLSICSLYGQMPDALVIVPTKADENCSNYNYPGKWIKSTELSPALQVAFNDRPDYCECYSHEDSEDYIVFFSEYASVYFSGLGTAISGKGCETSIGNRPSNTLAYNELNLGCNLEDYVFIRDNDGNVCYTFSQYPPIPTLSQWGLITLAIAFLIIGLVAVRQRVIV
jgi:hypothetical protein